MSIGENWFAPQPTANRTNAIRIHAREMGRARGWRVWLAVVIIILTITGQLSNAGLTVYRLW
jgi:hypothetical protein